MQEADAGLLDASTVSNSLHCRLTTEPAPTATKADERALVFDNWMAAYGAESTPECPTCAPCERQFMAENRPKATKENQTIAIAVFVRGGMNTAAVGSTGATPSRSERRERARPWRFALTRAVKTGARQWRYPRH
jgi:hypothetical protein